jgi:hypothetical protein
MLEFRRTLGSTIPFQFFLLLVIISPQVAHGQTESTAIHVGVDQFSYSGYACVPTCIINSLAFGGKDHKETLNKIAGKTLEDKLRTIIQLSQRCSSTLDANRTAFDEESGVKVEDNEVFFNFVLRTYEGRAVVGKFANRTNGESDSDQLARIHSYLKQSVGQELPPLVSLTALAAKRDNDGNLTLWQAVRSHCIVVTKVPSKISENQDGFTFEYVEPAGGVIREGYAYVEKFRDYSSRNGDDPTPLTGRPFILVLLPSLNLQDSDMGWNARGIVCLTHITGQLEIEKRE